MGWTVRGTVEDLEGVALGEYARKDLPALPLVEFEIEVDGEGYNVMMRADNHAVGGRYGPEQRVEIDGYLVDVWAHKSQMLHASGKYKGDLVRAAAQVAKIAAQKCEHKNSRELSMSECKRRKLTHWGSCWHVYLCEDCGDTWGVDSSG